MEEILSSGTMSAAEVLANYSPLALAYLGDAVYELEIREFLLRQGNASPKSLNDRAAYFAMARTQALLTDILAPHLTEAEADVLRRGRNASPNTVAKHATTADYHKATGLEALVGYLHLSGQHERVRELMDLARKAVGTAVSRGKGVVSETAAGGESEDGE